MPHHEFKMALFQTVNSKEENGTRDERLTQGRGVFRATVFKVTSSKFRELYCASFLCWGAHPARVSGLAARQAHFPARPPEITPEAGCAPRNPAIPEVKRLSDSLAEDVVLKKDTPTIGNTIALEGCVKAAFGEFKKLIEQGWVWPLWLAGMRGKPSCSAGNLLAP